MGKVYSQELRDQDAELKTHGAVSAATRSRATSAWVPDFSSYDFGEEFVRWEGIEFKDVQRAHSLWRKLGANLTFSRNGYLFFVNQTGLSKRQSKDIVALAATHGGDGDSTTGPPVLSSSDVNKLEVLRQFDSFLAKAKDYGLAQQRRKIERQTNTPVTPPRISALDLLSGLALVSKATPTQKAGFIFGLFDFHRRKKLDRDEILALVAASMRGYCSIKNAPLPPPEGLTWLVDETLFQAQRLDKTRDTIALNSFVTFCKRSPSVDIILNTADAVATGSGSAFAERRLALQKKLLTRLARIEASLEALGEAPFPPDEIRDLITNTAQTRSLKEHQAFLQQGVSESKPETDDLIAASDNQAGTLPSRRGAQVHACLVHSWFPELKPQTQIRASLDPAFAGLSIEQYSNMSEADRLEWSDSTSTLVFLIDKLEALWPLDRLYLPKCTSQWLFSLAAFSGALLDVANEPQAPNSEETQRPPNDQVESAINQIEESLDGPADANVDIQLAAKNDESSAAKVNFAADTSNETGGEFANASSDNPNAKPATGDQNFDPDEASSAPNEKHAHCEEGASSVEKADKQAETSQPIRDVSLSALAQWIRTWPLAEEVLARTSTGKYWAWSRVLSPLARALGRAVMFGLSSPFDRVMTQLASHLWIGDRYDQKADTTLAMAVNLDPDDTFAVEATLEYRERGESARRMEENAEAPELDDEDATETALDQLDYELSLVENSPVLERGKTFYERAFHDTPMDSRGSLVKSNLPATDGVTGYLMIDLAVHVSATPEELTLAAFKLRVFLTHEYFVHSTAVIGAHVIEVAEFKGSAKKLRLVLFFKTPLMTRIVSKLTEWFGRAESLALHLSMGANVEQALESSWNGELEALWEMPQEDGTFTNINQADDARADSMRSQRKRAFDPAWARRLGLQMPSLAQSAPAKLPADSRAAQSSTSNQEDRDLELKLAQAMSEREVHRRARLRIAEKKLTTFGHECVAILFATFDTDRDGALSLDEMNAMQRALDSAQFSSTQEYVSALQEDGAVVDHQGFLTLDGLEQLYIRTAPECLAKDLGMLGIKSCSLARVPVQASLRVVGPMLGRICAQTSSQNNDAASPANASSCDRLGHLQSLFAHGFRLFQEGKELWRQHNEAARLEVAYPDWVGALRYLTESAQVCLPQSAFSYLRDLVFRAGFARNLAFDTLAFTRGLLFALSRAQVGCLDDEVEDATEQEGKTDVDAALEGQVDSLGESEGFDADGDKSSENDRVPADVLERQFSKSCYHLCSAFQFVIAGVARGELRFQDDRAVVLSGTGMNIVDWFVGPTKLDSLARAIHVDKKANDDTSDTSVPLEA
ncbi:Hypothetical Protein FCC1311_033302 [Hondaea fermentalgiana]|uniref:EF-hand domain-containing protein n=1 Tax=Hondaea fermentalgiana TaxID=2315210 RepID=A0A2R5G7U5_9STRA|nr:Hypothetical Protein FCC1311_033302 [Hondaea fermentalgiana]|eukprot:GBG27107.1 Hypothetical Protein FCC1311_033302 [Hondaea fermentalgiana]